MCPVRGSGGVPRGAVGSCGVFRSKVRAIKLELHAGNAHVSLALAETVMLPETVAAFVGVEIETVGGVVSAFATVTVTEAIVVLPAASRARALRVWLPLLTVALFQLTL